MKVVKAPPKPLKTISARDEMLIKKMLELLKKYGCEFCDRRFDTKFALSHHERCRSSCFFFLAFLNYSETSFVQESLEGAPEEGGTRSRLHPEETEAQR